jgi:hypothetical protein
MNGGEKDNQYAARPAGLGPWMARVISNHRVSVRESDDRRGGGQGRNRTTDTVEDRKFYRTNRAMDGWKVRGILGAELLPASICRNASLPA